MNERTRSRLSRADRPARSLSQFVRADAAAIVIAIAAVITVGVVVLAGPARVDHLTISNSSEFDIGVDVAPGDGGGWLPIAFVDSGVTREYRAVLDQGSTWTLRFHSQGHDASVTMSRDDLAAADWHVSVPESAIDLLRQSGARPSPCAGGGCQSTG